MTSCTATTRILRFNRRVLQMPDACVLDADENQPAQSANLGVASPLKTLHVDAGDHEWAQPLQGRYTLQDDHHNGKPSYMQERPDGVQRRFYLRFARDSRWGF